MDEQTHHDRTADLIAAREVTGVKSNIPTWSGPGEVNAEGLVEVRDYDSGAVIGTYDPNDGRTSEPTPEPQWGVGQPPGSMAAGYVERATIEWPDGAPHSRYGGWDLTPVEMDRVRLAAILWSWFALGLIAGEMVILLSRAGVGVHGL